MALFERELSNVRNPAYGASLLYAVLRGHADNAENSQGLALPHLFVALPLLLNPNVLVAVSHTQAGLRNVAEKLDRGRDTGADLLRTLLFEAKAQREFTLQSLNVLLHANVATLNPGDATVSLSPSKKPLFPSRKTEGYDEGLRLGKWLSTLSVFEISSITKVVY